MAGIEDESDKIEKRLESLRDDRKESRRALFIRAAKAIAVANDEGLYPVDDRYAEIISAAKSKDFRSVYGGLIGESAADDIMALLRMADDER